MCNISTCVCLPQLFTISNFHYKMYKTCNFKYLFENSHRNNKNLWRAVKIHQKAITETHTMRKSLHTNKINTNSLQQNDRISFQIWDFFFFYMGGGTPPSDVYTLGRVCELPAPANSRKKLCRKKLRRTASSVASEVGTSNRWFPIIHFHSGDVRGDGRN